MEMNRELQTLNSEQLRQLSLPLPAEAVTPHPTKKFLSSIKSIYVTERLNEVFGVGRWRIETDVVEKQERMVVVKLKFTIPDYGIYYECYGGNDNPDLGDAYKGATTDAITKVASWLGIGADVFKGKYTNGKFQAAAQNTKPAQPAAPDPIPAAAAVQSTPKKRITADMLNDPVLRDQFMRWAYKGSTTVKDPTKFDVIAFLRRTYDADDTTAVVFAKFYDEYLNSKQQKR
ncbi:Rad52/Rad22 family DNA repair protein [Alistipes putredinis]|uniref:Rad52/Rad22 family DNA repair protein n=1 Tax=Alistipes putredinis TaxID=28117 RepID=UPI002AC31905|nr:Rad52/Rad22 family DNA repair protein [Alistipes putredinis]